jgi:hypothetical protein
VKFYLPAHCTGDHFGFFAIVEITEEMKRRLLDLRDVFKVLHEKDAELYQQTYWDSLPDWYEDSEVSGEDAASLEVLVRDIKVFRLLDDFELPGSPLARVECSMRVVTEQGVYWKCMPKHTSERVETERIEWAMRAAKSKSQYKRLAAQGLGAGHRRGKK